MKFTYSWLKQYLETSATIQEICDALTNSGLEVESVQDKSQLFAPFIIAEILSAEPHPDANKLQVCQVNDGNSTMQIVCGASNARAGIKVVLAPVGSIIPVNNLQIKEAKIRGVESKGMLCSANELGLENSSEGILEIDASTQLGMKFSEYANLNDTVIEIGLTPNRGDAACVYGIARDLSALGLGKLKPYPETSSLAPLNTSHAINIEDKENCADFSITIIEGLVNHASLPEVDSYIKLIGSTPKSALVSLSNFSMLEYGRPNHFYDLDKVDGNFTIRQSRAGEKFIPLGLDEISLPEGLLVVADDKKVLAIAGVIGGEASKVDETTTRIAIEVADFCPIAVSKAGRALNIHTDSRFRFERRIDFGNTDFFVSYIASRIQQYCGGEIKGTASAQGIKPQFTTRIPLSFTKIDKICGQAIDQSEALRILAALGFERDGEYLKVPTYRQGDVCNETDIAEEVIRIYGLNRIGVHPIELSPDQISISRHSTADTFRNLLTSIGFNEVITWSFVSEHSATLFSFDNALRVANPISAEMSVMRQTILPMLLQSASQNLAQGIKDLALFETGSVYHPGQELPAIAGIKMGMFSRKTHYKGERPVDYFDAKSYAEQIITSYGLDPSSLNFIACDKPYYHPGKSAAIALGKNVLGYCGEIHPNVLTAYKIEEPVVAFEFNIQKLPPIRVKNAKAKLQLSNLQQVSRDFAFLVEGDMAVGQILKSVKGCAPTFIETVSLFDVYQGDKVELGKKSIAINVLMRPSDETFTDVKIEEICQKIISFVQKEYKAELR